jgi:gliding motility-associated-like protein
MLGNASFGAPGSPPGYHPHSPGTGVGAALAEVYDYGLDGWTVGAPPFMGDYTYPGTPFEGWAVQWGGTARVQGYQWSGAGYAFAGGATMTGGGITSYSNAGGRIRAYWQGTTGPGGIMLMKSETRVDTLASAVVVTNYFYNTSAVTTVPSVYFWRSCDPDNDQTWPGGGFPTANFVNHQDVVVPNPTHKVMVTGRGNSATRPPLTLCTKDCRAVACVYNSWPLGIGTDLATIWARTYMPAQYTIGVPAPGDIGIGLVYNIGNILPGDSAVISYAYVFNDTGGIDHVGALPDPVLSVAGTIITTYPDTVDGCSLPPGVFNVPLDVLYGEDKCWTWSKWTWSPGVGLSATTGCHVICNTSMLAGPTTYTISGTDSATGMRSCNTKQFVITISPCHFATATDPCVGDTLRLDMTGDTVGATYFWRGPGGFTAHIRNPWRFPTTLADTGYYYVVKTVAGIHDTDYVRVVLHPLPIVNATSNIPNMCDPFVNPFNLFANLDSAGETFLWSGPLGFTSTAQNPVINPFDSSMQGTYTVTGTTIWGCKATNTTDVRPGVTIGFDFKIHYGCVWDTVYFTNTTYNADKYVWSFNDGTPDVTTRHTFHVFRARNDTITVRLRATNPLCAAVLDKVIDLRHSIHAAYDATPDTICFNGGTNSITFTNNSYADDSMFTNQPISGWRWDFADGTSDPAQSPLKTFNAPGIFPVKLVVSDGMGCEDSVTHDIYVVDIKVKSFHDTMLCVSQPLALTNEIISVPDIDPDWNYKFQWSQSPTVNLDNDTVQIPNLFGVGVFTNVLTVTIPGIVPDGCPVTNTMVINSVLGKKLQKLTVSQTIDFGSSVQLNASNGVYYYWMPNDGSLDNNNINNPVATPKRTTTYTVYGLDDNGCKDSAYITIFVDTTMEQDVPTAFSPNGDGVNDVFRPVGMKFQNLVEFRVFNRWGQEIFYTNSKEGGWDGTFHGTPQDLGVYNYLIIVARPGQDNVVYKGNVTLVR